MWFELAAPFVHKVPSWAFGVSRQPVQWKSCFSLSRNRNSNDFFQIFFCPIWVKFRIGDVHKNLCCYAPYENRCSTSHTLHLENFLYFSNLFSVLGKIQCKKSAHNIVENLWISFQSVQGGLYFFSESKSLHLLLYHETLWYFENKEQLCRVSVLRRLVHHLQFC